MIRAGTGSEVIDEFKRNNVVAIGWSELGDLTNIKNKSEIKSLMYEKFPKESNIQKGQSTGMVWKFINTIKEGDYVISYNSSTRNYLIGKISSKYIYKPEGIGDYNKYVNCRNVKWTNEISRDDLSLSSKNQLGSLLTVFNIKTETKKDILKDKKNEKQTEELENEEVEALKDDTLNQSIELIKDLVMSLDWDEMEELVAGLLRAMGYKTIISPAGPDKGKDIIASPDGLGLEDPKILVEVKHRKNTMSAPNIRNFMGVLQQNDKGLYVSTGGFSKEAEYEAERSQNPITLMDIDMLVKFIIQYYDNFDNDARTLVPLKKIYWPLKL